jgi:hypothetical protein
MTHTDKIVDRMSNIWKTWMYQKFFHNHMNDIVHIYTEDEFWLRTGCCCCFPTLVSLQFDGWLPFVKFFYFITCCCSQWWQTRETHCYPSLSSFIIVKKRRALSSQIPIISLHHHMTTGDFPFRVNVVTLSVTTVCFVLVIAKILPSSLIDEFLYPLLLLVM